LFFSISFSLSTLGFKFPRVIPRLRSEHSSLATPSTLPLPCTRHLPQELPGPGDTCGAKRNLHFSPQAPLPPIASYLLKAQSSSSQFFKSHTNYSKQQRYGKIKAAKLQKKIIWCAQAVGSLAFSDKPATGSGSRCGRFPRTPPGLLQHQGTLQPPLLPRAR